MGKEGETGADFLIRRISWQLPLPPPCLAGQIRRGILSLSSCLSFLPPKSSGVEWGDLRKRERRRAGVQIRAERSTESLPLLGGGSFWFMSVAFCLLVFLEGAMVYYALVVYREGSFFFARGIFGLEPRGSFTREALSDSSFFLPPLFSLSAHRPLMIYNRSRSVGRGRGRGGFWHYYSRRRRRWRK